MQPVSKRRITTGVNYSNAEVIIDNMRHCMMGFWYSETCMQCDLTGSERYNGEAHGLTQQKDFANHTTGAINVQILTEQSFEPYRTVKRRHRELGWTSTDEVL